MKWAREAMPTPRKSVDEKENALVINLGRSSKTLETISR